MKLNSLIAAAVEAALAVVPAIDASSAAGAEGK